MSSTLYARETAIASITAIADLTGQEKKFYKLDGSNQAILCTSAADVPDGVIGAVDPSNGLSISAIKCGGNHGPVKLLLGADVTDLRKDLTLRADATVEPDDGSGPRVVVARPMETGTAGEAIECILLKPRVYGAAVAANATANATDLASAEALANSLKTTVNAAIAALQTAGFLA